MVKKKLLALMLVLLMGIGCLTGCSPAEKRYYGLMSEVSTQRVFTDSGSYIINLTTLPTSMFTGQEAMSAQTLGNALGQLRIEYQGQVDIKQEVFQYDYTIYDTRAKSAKGAFSVAGKNGTIYMKIDGIMGFIKEFCSAAERDNLDRIFAGVVWVSIDDRDISGWMPDGRQSGVLGQLFDQSSGQQLVFKKLLDGLVNDAYGDYSTSLVSQNGNKYTMTLRGRDLMDVFESGAVYTIKNIDKIGQTFKGFFNGLTPAQAAQLGLTSDARLKAIQSLDQMVMEIKRDSGSAIREIQAMSAASETELLKIVNDSEIISSVEKTGANSYQVTSRLHLNISDPAKPTDRLVCTFSLEQNIKTGGNVQVAVPAGAVSLGQLQAKYTRAVTVQR